MRKVILAVLFLLPFMLFLRAGELVVAPGAYYFQDDKLRDIYKKFATDYSIEYRSAFPCKYGYFIRTDYLNSMGKTLGGKTPTRLQMLALSLGTLFSQSFPEESGYVYAGFGLAAVGIRINDSHPFIHNQLDRVTLGEILKAGISFTCSPKFNFDLSLNYLNAPFSTAKVSSTSPRYNFNSGGVSFNVGLKYTFGTSLPYKHCN